MTQPVALREPSLLEKLLVKDIRAEHSRLLQCMRFIVANNFLQDLDFKPLQFPPESSADAAHALGIPCTLLHCRSRHLFLLSRLLRRSLADVGSTSSPTL